MGRVTVRRKVVAVDGTRAVQRMDTLAVEEPLEIRLGGAPLSLTMRTPGHDVELVHGLLLAEGVIRERGDVVTARYCAGAVTSGETGFDENTYNVLDVALTLEATARLAATGGVRARTFATSSACGVCGAESVEQVLGTRQWDVSRDESRWAPTQVTQLVEQLGEAQTGFAKTGGLHGAALFDPDGTLVVAREDVGRHNAVDKVIGHAVVAGGLPLRGHVLVVSSRASFELAQKAVMAGIPALVTVSAPSSLAVEVGTRTGLTVIGFAREGRFNVYSGAQRVVTEG